jgi:VanZ like family
LKKFTKWWLPVIVWMIVIFIGSSIGLLPRVGGKTTDGIAHRVAHMIEFAVLGALTLRAVSKERSVTKRDMAIALVICVVYGASDEFHQRFTPGRSSEGLSVLFDVAGGLIGAWAYRWSTNRRRLNRAAAEQRTGESANQHANGAIPDPES